MRILKGRSPMKRTRSLRMSWKVTETIDIAHRLHGTTTIAAGLDPGLLTEGEVRAVVVISTNPLLVLPCCGLVTSSFCNLQAKTSSLLFLLSFFFLSLFVLQGKPRICPSLTAIRTSTHVHTCPTVGREISAFENFLGFVIQCITRIFCDFYLCS